MSLPRVRLSRIIALNWYGFRTIIDVNGLTLLCGETGTGKSALLDLIQFVLCPDSAKFNKAAAGDKIATGGGKSRDLRGYCLCDTNTKDRESGQARYLRRNGASIAALEFEWPLLTGETEPRRETWGLRIEFESATAQPSYVRFFAPQRLERDDLCDENGDLLSEDAFKMQVKRELGGDAGFTTHKAYMEEMGVPRHLQFDPSQMRKTLPKAIAFELDSDYQRFIRNFILERNDLDISSTKSSLEALRDTEKRVETLSEQLSILTTACAAHEKYAEAAREFAIHGHLRHALRHAQAAEELAQCESAIEKLKVRNKDDLAAMEKAVSEKEAAQQSLNAMRAASGHEKVDKLNDAKSKAEKLQVEHDELKRMAKTAREFLAQRARAWADWRRHATSLGWEITADMERVDLLSHHETTKALDAVVDTRGVFGSIWNDTEARLKPGSERVSKLEGECASFERQLKQLDRRSTAPTPLLDALRSTGTKANTLGRLVEVSAAGEPWWGMIEALLADEKNAVLLDDQRDYAKALDLWRRTTNAEPLIRPTDLTAAKAQDKSLATFIETENEHARHFVDRRLGRFVAVNTAKDLELYDTGAVTPDGLLNDPPVRRRLTPEREFTLGEKGIQRLRTMKEAALAEATTELNQLRQRRDDVMTMAKRVKARILQASTSEVYGDPEVHPQPESYWGKVNPIGIRSCYDEGKRCAETLFFDYHRQHNTDIKVIRIFNTYGPRMHPNDGRVVSNFIVQALRGQDITIYGTGSQTRSFCYVDDLVEGMMRMMDTEAGFTGPINLGNPGEFTMLELAEKVISLVGSKSKLTFMPLPQDDPKQRKPIIDLARSKLGGWEPKVQLEDGLKETIAYFRKALAE